MFDLTKPTGDDGLKKLRTFIQFASGFRSSRETNSEHFTIFFIQSRLGEHCMEREGSKAEGAGEWGEGEGEG
jgi:hypothetical protein